MGETKHIAEMAQILSSRVFGELFWTTTGPTDTNWNCVDPRHQLTPTSPKSHPSDVVFYYDNPYSLSRTYVQTDLKSYKKGSITATAINIAAANLAKSLACVEKSESFQDLYFHESVNAEIAGLLFIYNHDGQYDHEFEPLLRGVDYDGLEIPEGRKLVIFGPEDIYWLNNVARDIGQLRGDRQLPMSKDNYGFYYPNLGRKSKVQPQKARAATLEMLTSPWVILEHGAVENGSEQGFVIYYRPRGKRSDEYVYLIDYILHFQLLDRGRVSIRTIDPEPNATAKWGRAVQDYIDAQEAGEDLKLTLDKITFGQVTDLNVSFSPIEIGMRDA
jgi:hypothetical protein